MLTIINSFFYHNGRAQPPTSHYIPITGTILQILHRLRAALQELERVADQGARSDRPIEVERGHSDSANVDVNIYIYIVWTYRCIDAYMYRIV